MSVEHPRSLFAGVEPLEVFVELLADLDTDDSPTEFYDRICEAICRLTTMRRAAIFMADAGRRRVRVVGSHGTSFKQLATLAPTPSLIAAPIAQRALREDAVVVVSDRIEDVLPPEYGELFGITTLVCTPLSAAGRAYGVICADRGGGRFELSDGERHLLWTLGKTAALVATARNATRQQERNTPPWRADRACAGDPRARHAAPVRRLARAQRRALIRRRRARTVPGRDAGGAQRPAQRARAPARAGPERDWDDARGRAHAGRELRRATGSRSTGHRPSPCRPRSSRWRSRCWPRRCATSPSTRPHRGSRSRSPATPTRSRSRSATTASATRARGAGMGLRLAAFEALQHGGVVEFGAPEDGRWRVRLVVPHAKDDAVSAPTEATR